MDPVLNDAELRLRQVARDAASGHVGPAAERIEDDRRVPDELLRELASAGLLGVDPEAGVDGRLQIVLVGEEIGRASAAAGVVVAVHAAATQALREADPGRYGNLIGELRDGGRRIAVVDGVRLTDDGRIDAGERLIAAAAGATDLLVVARGAGGEARLFLLPADGEGVDVEEAPALVGLQGGGAAAVRLDVTPSADDLWGEGGVAEGVVELLRLAGAAVAVGVAGAALDAGLAAVHRRTERGEAVDRSQTVQWDLADIATETEAARLSTWFAAGQPPGSREAREATASARMLAAEAGARGSRRAVQVAGPDGARRGPLERLYRDAKVLEMLAGSTEEQFRAIARELLPELTGA